MTGTVLILTRSGKIVKTRRERDLRQLRALLAEAHGLAQYCHPALDSAILSLYSVTNNAIRRERIR